MWSGCVTSSFSKTKNKTTQGKRKENPDYIKDRFMCGEQGRGKEQEGQNVKRVNRRVWVTQKCLSFMWTFGLRFTGQILWLWAQPKADGRRRWWTGHHLHPPLIWRHITLSSFPINEHTVSPYYSWQIAQGSVRKKTEKKLGTLSAQIKSETVWSKLIGDFRPYLGVLMSI